MQIVGVASSALFARASFAELRSCAVCAPEPDCRQSAQHLPLTRCLNLMSKADGLLSFSDAKRFIAAACLMKGTGPIQER